MTTIETLMRRGGGLAIMLSCLMLAACLLTPGRFDSTMDVRKNGNFSFRYSGEMVFLPLADPAAFGKSGSGADTPCYDEDDGSERPCTASERAEQSEQAARNAEMSARSEAEMAKAILGGIDPKDPKAGESFAEKLRRQAGWRKAVYKGNGVFDIEFAISGQLDRDFVFPTIEGLPMANAFVTVYRRNDNTVRIEAPGFAVSPGALPGQAMLGMATDGGESTTRKPPEMSGTFALRSDGEVLANNTDEGPGIDPTGKVLTWRIGQGTATPPTALIRLSR